jgi:hypothetical protein
MFNPVPAAQIALVVMTVALQAAYTKDTVGSFLKTSEHVHYIDFAGTGNTEYFYICGI